jgi:multidrug resistance protein
MSQLDIVRSKSETITLRDPSISIDVPRKSGFAQDEVITVDWDGPDDPENPKNWSFKSKWAITAVVSSFTFISPVASSMVAPAAVQVAEDLHITSSVVVALTISVFVLAYAVGPLFLGPMSEIFGRYRVLQLANLWFLAFNLGCGFAQTKGQLIGLRFLAGLGGSAPLAVGGGVLADVFNPEQRGTAIALYSLMPMLGPVVGPITGAWIAQKSTWRWVFWSLTIVDGAIQVVGFIFLRETYAPVLLEQKAAKIRKSFRLDEEKGRKAPRVHTVYDDASREWKALFKRSLIRPFVFGATEPIIQLFGLYMMLIYGMLYIFLTSIPTMFYKTYHKSVGITGLHYAALGLGLFIAMQITARLMDKVYVHLKQKNGGVRKPEFRLPTIVPGTILLPAGLLITGWTIQAKTHWIGPDVGLALVGGGTVICFQGIQTYIVDCYSLHAASALAAVSFMRSLAGFGFPLFAPAMYDALGYGKADTILAAIAIGLGCPAPWLFWKYGERIRNRSRFAVKT